MEQTEGQTGMVFYNYNPVDGTLTSTSTPVQIEFGSADVARQINQQVQLQYSNLQGIQPGQTQQIVITSQPTFDTTEDIDPLLIKCSKTKIRANGERVPCDICGKTFSCNANLRDHMRLHTGERPFQCSECGMSFAQRSNWRLHKRVHTGERPYMCGICGKTFSRSSHLPGHIRVHTGERPFQCGGCDHSFSSSQSLKNHMRTHTGEKPFACEHCSTTFAHSSTLSSHKKRCTGIKRKRGRPVGSGRRRRRSINRPRGRPKKRGRFGRRGRKKTEEDTLANDGIVKEELRDDTLKIFNDVVKNVTNGNEDHLSSHVDIPVGTKDNLDEPLLCSVTEANIEETLLCKIPNATNGEILLHKLTEPMNNGNPLVCNVTEPGVIVSSHSPDFITQSLEKDVKPLMINNVISAVSADNNVEMSTLADSSDLRQEAAVAMTTLHHSVINIPNDDDQHTF